MAVPARSAEIILRVCRESDPPELEWSGGFSDRRELAQKAYERKQEGEVEMLVAIGEGWAKGSATSLRAKGRAK